MFQFIYAPVISDLYAVCPISFDTISKITDDKMGQDLLDIQYTKDTAP